MTLRCGINIALCEYLVFLGLKGHEKGHETEMIDVCPSRYRLKQGAVSAEAKTSWNQSRLSPRLDHYKFNLTNSQSGSITLMIAPGERGGRSTVG
jgi:hypothetical protein